MKLSLHEQKVLDIISNHPEIIDNPQDRTRIAKIYNLTEKTLRNRIAELKKRGLLNNGESQLNNHNSTVLDLNIQSLLKLLLNRKVFIIKWTFFITMIFIVYSLIATPFFKSKTVELRIFNCDSPLFSKPRFFNSAIRFLKVFSLKL